MKRMHVSRLVDRINQLNLVWCKRCELPDNSYCMDKNGLCHFCVDFYSLSEVSKGEKYFPQVRMVSCKHSSLYMNALQYLFVVDSDVEIYLYEDKITKRLINGIVSSYRHANYDWVRDGNDNWGTYIKTPVEDVLSETELRNHLKYVTKIRKLMTG